MVNENMLGEHKAEFGGRVGLERGLLLYPLPLGHHTLGIESKSVLSTGVVRMLVGNLIGVGLTRSTIRIFYPI